MQLIDAEEERKSAERLGKELMKLLRAEGGRVNGAILCIQGANGTMSLLSAIPGDEGGESLRMLHDALDELFRGLSAGPAIARGVMDPDEK